VESPLVCVSGVSGSNVKNRIRDIMTNRAVVKLSVAKKAILAGVGIVAVVAPTLAQSVPLPSAPALRFDVASVKRSTEASGQVRVGDQIWSSAGASFKPGGVFEAVNATLGSIIRLAYGLKEFETVGAPEWVNTDRFDIQARGPQGAAESENPRRLQALLAERFALKAHKETRDRPIYALVRARANGALGPRIRQSEGPPADGFAAAGGRCTPPGPGPTSMRLCGVTMASFVDLYLPMYTDRKVVDRTGLTGGFDLALNFDNRQMVAGVGPAGGLGAPPTVAADPDALSIFTALEEQLGLKLEKQTGPAEVLVIDHVEPPTPN
jgi:uncharacterized protein (TIGR03435 family)